MSKRLVSIGRTMAVALAVLALLSLASQPAMANPLVYLSDDYGVMLGGTAWISVVIENQSGSLEFGGFDFLIGYDASGLTLQQVHMGSMLDSCGWEYFTDRLGPFGNCAGTCPSGMLRIVGIADVNNGNYHPWCFLDGRSGDLARMKFHVTTDSNYNCAGIPVRFYWTDCGDNVLSSVSGDTLYLSHRVFDSDLHPEITGQDGYGGWQGIEGNTNCLQPPSHVTDTLIDFRNGEVRVLCVDPWLDWRGDLNMNDIANEIADLVMYCDYFLQGVSAFTHGNIQGAIDASDINADGIYLSYRDLVYLLRVVYGDALPFPKQPLVDSLTATFAQDTLGQRVSVSFSGELAGAYIEMTGNVVPHFTVPLGFKADYRYDGSRTRILILGDLDHRYGSGVWFTYEGTGVLTHAETTDWFNHHIEVLLSGMSSDCGDANASGDYDISDAVYLVRYIFGGGPAPLDSHGGDVNCDATCDISDVVYMLHYIFTFGPMPCNGCR